MSRRGFDHGRKTIRCLAATLLLSATCASMAAAQAQQGGIIGQVRDESGAILPGVTVTTTSPALQVPSIVVVTDQNGEYRVTPLPIGVYTVEYSLAGFQGVRRENIQLAVGFTAKIDIALKVGAVEETITVSGASPIVDVKSAASTTELTQETIELIPTSRNGIVSLLTQTPGVRTLLDVGGSSLNTVPTYHVFGMGGEPYSTLEGVQTSSLQSSGGQANYWDYTALEEAAVSTLGNGPEVPSRGVYLNAVVKSGGNDFHGSANAIGTGHQLQGNNIQDIPGVTLGDNVDSRYSFQGDLGGRIVKDKLWFYGDYRIIHDNRYVLNAYKADGSPAISDQLSWFHTEKLSYQMSPSNKIIGFYQFNHKYDPSGISQYIPYESRNGLTTHSSTAKIEWQKTTSTLVTSVQYGHWQYHSEYWAFAPPGLPATTDQLTLQQTGPGTTVGQRPYNPRDEFKGTATWYRPDLFKGNHEFKFGGVYTGNHFGRQYPALDPSTQQPDGAYSSYMAYPTYQLIYRNGAPFNIAVFNLPALALVYVDSFAVYGNDTWTTSNRRWTLNLGLRYQHDNGWVPDSCRAAGTPPADIPFPAQCFPKQQFNVFSSVAPRLYSSWDVLGTGKTVIKAGWGRFDHPRQLNPELDGADPQVRTTDTFTWHDLNNDKQFQIGEANLDPNGPDFRSQSGGSNTIANPNEKQPKTDVASVSLEQEVKSDLALRVSGVYSRTFNYYRYQGINRPYDSYSIAVTNPDPGPDGKVGTADDPGRQITYYEYPTSLAPAKFGLQQLSNDRTPAQTYKSIDIAFFKRYSHRWSFNASYTATLRDQPYGSDEGDLLSAPLTPNGEINTGVHAWEWTAKVSGVYGLPYGLQFSGNFVSLSGAPTARTVSFTGGKTITSITLNVDPIGTLQLPTNNQLDLRLEKAFSLARTQKLLARVSMFNALNASTVTGMTVLSSVNYLKPTSIAPPRITEFSVTYQF